MFFEKKLIIVCDGKTEKYANYLRQLISLKDDTDDKIIGSKDGTVDVAVWLEKDYVANKQTVSTNQYVLFIGKNKTSKNEDSSMNVVFDEHNMKYGWLGKRGMLRVDDKALTAEEYDSFYEFALGYKNELERIVLKHNSGSSSKSREKNTKDDAASKKSIPTDSIINGVATAAVAIGTYTLSPIIGLTGAAALGVSAVSKVQIQKKIKDQQYRTLIVMFYVDGLKNFLEG